MSTMGESTEIDYATLSHCWGNSMPLKLTKETLAAFEERIPFLLIPPTFTETINIARSIGIRYIWIDSLCIVQDDPEDWEREAAQMNRIYAGSQLTIAAAQSSDYSGGCFHNDFQDQHGLDLFFKAQLGNPNDSPTLVRFYQGNVRDRPIRRNRLSTRAWTLQEQLLSSRLVSRLHPELHWQCRTEHKTEGGLVFKSPSEAGNSVIACLPRIGPQGQPWLRVVWESIVEQYTARELTDETDRLAAFAGILRYFQSAFNEKPMIGLWKSALARDMAWVRLGVRENLAANPHIPSWTWLSCTGQASMSFFDITDVSPRTTEGASSHIEFLSWDIHWAGLPYTSPVKGSNLHVKGPVMDIEIGPSGDGVSRNPQYLQVFGENLTYTDRTKIPFRCVGQLDKGDIDRTASYPCLLLSSRTGDDTEGPTQEIFLILEPVKPEIDARYRRIGIAKLRSRAPVFDLNKTKSLTLV
ncbi:uncharacterized protein JN550_007724 [Neoarthrinium moseri]|uniref:uncharacterized protein n=1 Tax=Neoarthrinium moseri TaxID=1658444 RepID=UPI001FDBEA87|nr:uncharacterized protein JN550_007724 [Neoarthrinium moseri]KAI1866336.1 hypothetical protein JN550_007724 [Neoarthrinium moseri]